MLARAELERLRLQKQQLVLEDDRVRRSLVEDVKRLSSPQPWLGGAGDLVRKHPLVTAALAVAAGVIVIKALRRPGATMSLLGRLGDAAPALLAAWNLVGGPSGRPPSGRQ